MERKNIFLLLLGKVGKTNFKTFEKVNFPFYIVKT